MVIDENLLQNELDRTWEQLDQLPSHEKINVLQWTIVDVKRWALNDEVDDRVQGYAAMLDEAILYQITKAIDRLNSAEEQ